MDCNIVLENRQNILDYSGLILRLVIERIYPIHLFKYLLNIILLFVLLFDSHLNGLRWKIFLTISVLECTNIRSQCRRNLQPTDFTISNKLNEMFRIEFTDRVFIWCNRI
ncbi:hypothetical protein SAMN05421809_0763 [Natronorubrum daqingense]|uniref:Uncharacterized protein n=1 Tax=Natronorubrum daqingense TaxID=588898 RepID=A0A1N6ZD69_9EURY|nr:hypothetical protein SAMN05421809_0763 [Natronorubrum daqingense]